MAKHPKEPTVTFRFQEGEHYRILPCNGAFGGPTPTGEIMVNLVLDVFPAPDSVTYKVNTPTLGGHALGGEVDRKPVDQGIISRTMQVGVLMSPRVAVEVAKLLAEKAAQIIKPEPKDTE